VPGADRSHVHFGYVDPHLYAGRRVLVVGGRNSALEAVLRLRRVGAEVTLCYRRDRIDRERNSHKLAPLVCDAIDAGELPFLPRRVPVGFEGGAALLGPTDEAGLPTAGTVERVETDFAVVLIGFEADLSLMVQAGVQIDEEGRPAFDEKTQRTGVPGLYIAGTAVAGDGYGHPHFIETCHVHVDRILADLRS
jgi:thioredoxin reductase (NADPH)